MRIGQLRRGRLWGRALLWILREKWVRLPIGVRVLWLLLGVMLALMTPLFGLGYYFFQQSLASHQRLVQQQRLTAVVSALDRELAALLRHVADYTVWDDAHESVLQRDVQWIRRNIVDWLPQQFHYDCAGVVDARGTWMLRTEGDWEWLRQTKPFQQAMRGVSSAGLYHHEAMIYLIAAAPFVEEAWHREPAGVLIVVRAIDAPFLRRVSHDAGHAGALQVVPIADSTAPKTTLSFHTEGQEVQVLYDGAGRPIAQIQVAPPRAEQSWLLDALFVAKRYLLLLGCVLALVASLTLVLLLKRQLRGFSVAIQRLAAGNWHARVAYAAADEFGSLARAFNQMAQQLQQAFEAQEQQREELLAQKVALEQMHLEMAQLNAELMEANRALAQAAITDGLTGLKNHRAFQEALQSVAQMAERLQQPLSLIMFDIDHFKQFNDRFGHPAGDELLRQVAQVLRESARAYDVAARYGGEEFALLLPNTALEQAVQVAERLRQQIRAIENPHAPVSASFGIATYRYGTPPATLVYEADAALYRAKRAGRDQVCVYESEAA
ncbi:MAG: diguanylate cyclase [Fimbriimonadales bacterium]